MLYNFIKQNQELGFSREQSARPHSSIQRPESIVQGLESIVQSPVSSIQSQASRVQCPESSIQHLRPEPRNFGMMFFWKIFQSLYVKLPLKHHW